ncbi:MAG: nucleoside-diphosphate kinase [Methylococcales bacterium]
MEKTFVMIKPDGVQRGLIGEIIAVLERAGLKPLAMKLIRPSRELAEKHYPDTHDWYTSVGHKTIDGYALLRKDVEAEFGTDSPTEIGKTVKGWLIDFLSSGDVLAMVWEGNAAVINVRRLVGDTLPILAHPGSIRGRFSIDSPDAANKEKRPVSNLVHATSDIEDAINEIKLWFPEFELDV